MGSNHDTETVVLSRQQCLERLASTGLGRIGVSIDALPVILPVQFTLADDSVLFRTTKDTKLATATKGAVVAFQADAYDPMERGWWSVLLQGIATPGGDPEAEASRTSVPSSTWSAYPGEPRLLRVGSNNIHGRFVRGAGEQPPFVSD